MYLYNVNIAIILKGSLPADHFLCSIAGAIKY